MTFSITLTADNMLKGSLIANVESIEAGIEYLTARAEENGFTVLGSEIEDGVATVATAKFGTRMMNIYEIAAA